jgi:predicted MPP superfamily phosphohydrolase
LLRWVTALLVVLHPTVGGNLNAAQEPPPAATNELTFFGWSDQHVLPSGEGTHLHAAIDAMNVLPGTRYPERFGGTVVKPAFVFGCGDMTEWPSAAARDTYADLITRRLKWPSFDIVGNHDEGGNSPVETMKQWIIRRHGALSYTFDRAGVHFVALFSHYDESRNSPAQALSNEALGFLREDLTRQPAGTPVVVATHLCLDALTNRDKFIDTFGDANVVLILSGHYHKAQVDRYRNRNFVQLPSPAPNGEREVMVLRLQAGRLLVLPYNYETRQWVTEPRKMLDVSLARPPST